jgi:hypothetical protein
MATYVAKTCKMGVTMWCAYDTLNAGNGMLEDPLALSQGTLWGVISSPKGIRTTCKPSQTTAEAYNMCTGPLGAPKKCKSGPKRAQNHCLRRFSPVIDDEQANFCGHILDNYTIDIFSMFQLANRLRTRANRQTE